MLNLDVKYSFLETWTPDGVGAFFVHFFRTFHVCVGAWVTRTHTHIQSILNPMLTCKVSYQSTWYKNFRFFSGNSEFYENWKQMIWLLKNNKK